MKVKELIKQLQECDPEALVVMSSKWEDYSPLSDIYETYYLAESTWSGRVGEIELTEELKKLGYTEEDLFDEEDNPELAVCLCPVN